VPLDRGLRDEAGNKPAFVHRVYGQNKSASFPSVYIIDQATRKRYRPPVSTLRHAHTRPSRTTRTTRHYVFCVSVPLAGGKYVPWMLEPRVSDVLTEEAKEVGFLSNAAAASLFSGSSVFGAKKRK
jgi:hypothetical protein